MWVQNIPWNCDFVSDNFKTTICVTFTTLSRLLTYTNPSHDQDYRQWTGASLFFLFSGTCIFIPIVPLNHLIIIVNMIVIIPSAHLLLCYKPIGNILRRGEVIPHCLIANFLCFKVIRDISQLPWIYFNSLVVHLFCLKTVRDKKKVAGLLCITSLLMPCVLRTSGTNFRVYGSLRTASLQICCVLRWLETYDNERGSMCTASSHICCVLRCSGTSLIQCGTFS